MLWAAVAQSGRQIGWMGIIRLPVQSRDLPELLSKCPWARHWTHWIAPGVHGFLRHWCMNVCEWVNVMHSVKRLGYRHYTNAPFTIYADITPAHSCSRGTADIWGGLLAWCVAMAINWKREMLAHCWLRWYSIFLLHLSAAMATHGHQCCKVASPHTAQQYFMWQ